MYKTNAKKLNTFSYAISTIRFPALVIPEECVTKVKELTFQPQNPNAINSWLKLSKIIIIK